MPSLTVVAAVLLLPFYVQETPTEKLAAKTVIEKLDVLEKSVDAPGWVQKLTAPNAERDSVVARSKQLMDSELLALSDEIGKDPEIGFVEHHAVEKLTAWLKRHDFEVEAGVGGLRTAFTARWTGAARTAAPVMGIIVEYDALRGTKRPFHGDQHNAQGPIGLAAAVAMTEFLKRTGTPGTVVVFGTPGEEMMPPNAKRQMLEAGVFKGVDVFVRSHSSMSTNRPAPGFGTCCLNIDGVKFTFSGAPSHQMVPWDGRNALEAVVHFFVNIDSVRASIRPEARIQGIITEGGAAPNVVPDRTVADFYIRYPDEAYLEQVRQFVDDSARAAALATQTKVKIETYGRMRDGISVATLGELAFAYEKRLGGTHVEEAPGKPQGYEETGGLSSETPGIGMSVYSSSSAYHTYGMEDDILKETGHSAFLIDAEAMTAVLYDYSKNPPFRAEVKREFEGIKALFGEYQAALRKVYQVPNVPDPK
jgi:amidohydrolase